MSGETRRSSGSWRLAIDFGTSYTAAATERSGRITTVLFDGSPRIPSVVAVDDDGSIVVGAVAEREMARMPERAERCPKQRIGDSVVLLGARPVTPIDAVAAVLRYVFDEAVRQSGGARPAEVVLTHPARWGSVRLGLLAEAARRGGLPEPQFVSEPVAAAAAESEAAALGDGQMAAVFDLGGGTFDTAVVRRSGDRFDVVGPPGGNDRVGGETFDERLFVHLGEQLAQQRPDAWEHLRFNDERTWRRAAFDFRTAVRHAKEALSTRTDTTMYLGAPVDAEVRLTRDELERLIAPDVHVALAELAATVAAAGLTPQDLRSVFLVGGSSRIPLVARLVGEWFGRVPITWGDPKGAVVLGALMVGDAGRRRLTGVPPTAETPAIAHGSFAAGAAAAGAAAAGPDAAGGGAGETAAASDAHPVTSQPAIAGATAVYPVVEPGASSLAGHGAVPGSEPRDERRRTRWVAAAAIAAVLGLGGAAVALTGGDRDPRSAADATDGRAGADVPPTSGPPDTTAASTSVDATASAGPSSTPTTTATTATTATPTSSTIAGTPVATKPPLDPATATTAAPIAPAAPTTAPPGAPTATRPPATARPSGTAAPVVPPSTTAAPTPTEPPPTPTAAPTTVAPTMPPTTAAPQTVEVPNVLGADYAAAEAAIRNRGLNPYRPEGACTQSSTITDYQPRGQQLRGTTITLRCE